MRSYDEGLGQGFFVASLVQIAENLSIFHHLKCLLRVGLLEDGSAFIQTIGRSEKRGHALALTAGDFI